MKNIKYIKGDATKPIGEGLKIIVHCCNNEGKWGAGFVLALSKKWKSPEEKYRSWSKGWTAIPPFKLGEVLFVKVEKDIFVANMVGQDGVGIKNGISPIRYDAINECLKKISDGCLEAKASVHCPRFGAGLAGGKWGEIEKLIIKNLSEKDVQVTVYDIK